MPILATPPSINSIRCEYGRLHRNTPNTPSTDDCNKRKRQETSPEVVDIIEPPTKRRRGRPSKISATPGGRRTPTSTGSGPLAAYLCNSLDSGEESPTPEPNLQHIPKIEEVLDAGIIVIPNHSQVPVQDPVLDDTIMVDIFTIASQGGSDRPDTPNTIFDSPVAQEAPMEDQPGLEVAEHQTPDLPFIRGELDLENPFINQPPVDTHLNRVLAAAALERERDNIHHTVRSPEARDHEDEANRLRISRNAVREHLEASTALVHTLQARSTQRDGEQVAIRALLAQAQADLLEAQARVQRGRITARRLGFALAGFVFGIGMYFAWTWVNGPEMQYIRKRRGDILME